MVIIRSYRPERIKAPYNPSGEPFDIKIARLNACGASFESDFILHLKDLHEQPNLSGADLYNSIDRRFESLPRFAFTLLLFFLNREDSVAAEMCVEEFPNCLSDQSGTRACVYASSGKKILENLLQS